MLQVIIQTRLGVINAEDALGSQEPGQVQAQAQASVEEHNPENEHDREASPPADEQARMMWTRITSVSLAHAHTTLHYFVWSPLVGQSSTTKYQLPVINEDHTISRPSCQMDACFFPVSSVFSSFGVPIATEIELGSLVGFLLVLSDL